MLKVLRKMKRWFNKQVHGTRKPWLNPTASGTAPSPEQIFARIHADNVWGDEESASGAGSNLFQTRVVRAKLPGLIKDMGVRSMLDIPCGDFYWLSQVELDVESYVGADIVPALIEANQARHARTIEGRSITFAHMNLLTTGLPRIDLVLCRDCLVHLSTADVWQALRNIRRSGSTYLLTTTYPTRTNAKEIATGEWRPLNLEAPPFCLPAPNVAILEESTERKGTVADKTLALWTIADLAIA